MNRSQEEVHVANDDDLELSDDSLFEEDFRDSPAYKELVAGVKSCVVKPFFIGLSAAIGMSIGYKLVDLAARPFQSR